MMVGNAYLDISGRKERRTRMISDEKRAWVVELAPQTAELFARCAALLKPPPGLTLSQWADTYRMLSAENSAAPGR